MEPNSTSFDALLKISQAGTDISLNSSNSSINKSEKFSLNICNDVAYTSIPEIFNRIAGIDTTMDNITAFQNIIFTAQDSLALMQAEGNEINSLFKEAFEGDLAQDSTGSLIKHINSNFSEIKNIRNSASFQDINPFDGAISIEIPNWQNVLGLHNKTESDAKLSAEEFLSALGLNKDNETGIYTIKENETFNVCFTNKNTMQITVNSAFMPDNLTLSETNLKDENTAEAINTFVDVIKEQEYNMELASEIIGKIFTEFPSAEINNEADLNGNDVNNTNDYSSKEVQEQIIQNAALTIANTTCIIPGISTDML